MRINAAKDTKKRKLSQLTYGRNIRQMEYIKKLCSIITEIVSSAEEIRYRIAKGKIEYT